MAERNTYQESYQQQLQELGGRGGFLYLFHNIKEVRVGTSSPDLIQAVNEFDYRGQYGIELGDYIYGSVNQLVQFMAYPTIIDRFPYTIEGHEQRREWRQRLENDPSKALLVQELNRNKLRRGTLTQAGVEIEFTTRELHLRREFNRYAELGGRLMVYNNFNRRQRLKIADEFTHLAADVVLRAIGR